MSKNISIIIPCHEKDVRELSKLLTQLKILDGINGIHYEVIIIFNNFSNKIHRFKTNNNYLTKTFKESLIIGRARNIGASLSTGDYLIFIDSDVSIDRKSLLAIHKVITEMEKLRYSAILPNFSAVKNTSIFANLDSREDIRSYNYRIRDKNRKMATSLSGPFVLIKRSVFFKLGGWDEKNICAEDKDLAARIMESGGRIMFAPEIIIHHKNDSSLSAILKRKIFHAKCNALAYERYPKYFHRNFMEWYKIIVSKLDIRHFPSSFIYLNIMIFYIIVFNLYRLQIRLFMKEKLQFISFLVSNE